ncbi:hypothetical protein [Leeuwenhoekiella aestuarii]|uniref:Uncharacterized protein n=1 Tax=Leeuwenhoekiella aestuarii TaxID=2249426 RepID=A0A4V1KPL9_9FLAO|nr:hypothetical protein [Leeuwenhoekiella aestuarii]RXG16555.1 hypothetical protein DSM04_102128 [Leeuwenhoekiella aestuarii]
MYQETIQDVNPYYDQISYNYSGSVQLEEILHFLDLAFPKWKTNGGLGEFAPEFVIWILDHSSESYHNDSFFDFLKFVYFEIAEEYPKYEESQAFSFDLECIEYFPEESEAFYEALSEDEYKAQLEKYKASRREENAFDFIF